MDTSSPRQRALVRHVLVIVIVIYLLACLAPAISDRGGWQPIPGWWCLLIGWGESGSLLPRLANFLFFGGCAFFYCRHSGFAMALAVSAAVVGQWTYSFSGDRFEVRIGFYLWESSFMALVCGCYLLERARTAGAGKPHPDLELA